MNQLHAATFNLAASGPSRRVPRLNPGTTTVYTSLTADGDDCDRARLLDLVGDVVIDRPDRSVTVMLNDHVLVQLPRAYFAIRGVDSVSLRDMIDPATMLWYHGQLHHFFGSNTLRMVVDGRDRSAAVHIEHVLLDGTRTNRAEFNELRAGVIDRGVDLLFHIPTTVRFRVAAGRTVGCALPDALADTMIEALELSAADADRYIRRIRILLSGNLLHSFTPRARKLMENADGPVWRIPLGGRNDRGEIIGGIEAGRIDQFRIEIDGTDLEAPTGHVMLTLVRPAMWGSRVDTLAPKRGSRARPCAVDALDAHFEVGPPMAATFAP